MNIHDLLGKMESAESAFLNTEFLAPVLPEGKVRVRIAGVICTLHVESSFEAFSAKRKIESGWAILKPCSMEKAKIIAKPGLQQIRDYLSLFPAVRLLLVSRRAQGAGSRERFSNEWLAIPAHRGDKRFQIENTVTVHLVTGAEPFQQIIARYDGTRFWFQESDRRRSPSVAAYLRDALAAETPPDKLHKLTLTSEEREAYGLLWKAIEEARKDKIEIRLSEALAHAGATLSSYIERNDAYTVSFKVDGDIHRSTVRKDDLTVLTAGICLNGQDRKFDLQSLVSVLRQGFSEY